MTLGITAGGVAAAAGVVGAVGSVAGGLMGAGGGGSSAAGSTGSKKLANRAQIPQETALGTANIENQLGKEGAVEIERARQGLFDLLGTPGTGLRGARRGVWRMTAAHSKIGASSMDRWSACPGSVKLSEGIPSTSSVYAEEGTLAHSLAADWLTNGVKPVFPVFAKPVMHEAVAVYVGCGGHRTAAGGPWYVAKWLQALGSPRLYTSLTIGSPSLIIAYDGLFGGPLPLTVFDIDHADSALFVATNPVVSHLWSMPQSNPATCLKHALQRGMKLVVIDPRRTEVAARAHVHLPLLNCHSIASQVRPS